MSAVSGDYIGQGLRVAAYNRKLAELVADEQKQQRDALDASIESSEALLASLGVVIDDRPMSADPLPEPTVRLPAKSWGELLGEATASGPADVRFEDLLSAEEIARITLEHDAIGEELDWDASLSRYDVALCVAAGTLAGLIDIFLVGLPKTAGMLGGPANEGGWLSNLVKDKFGEILPADKIKALEDAYKVCYDPAVNSKLGKVVEGLGPRTHRYQSFGHDPILGFIFGVRDILTGEFTAISKHGEVIIQKVATPLMEGQNFVVRILEALRVHAGHLLSDVATPAGLPAPLMPLLSFLQFGKIGDGEYTIAEVSRLMYRGGYDFRHFLAASIPVAITEVIVRLGHVVMSIHAGKTLRDSLPLASDRIVRRKLLVAHGVAMTFNAGKVMVTQSPLAISWPQVIAVSKYLVPELRYLAFGKDAEKSALVEEVIANAYVEIYGKANAIALVDARPVQL